MSLTDPLTDIAKRLPYPLFLRLFLATKAAREHISALRLASKTGVPLLTPTALQQQKRSDVLVLLGGGSSINRITPPRWNEISRYDTIGLNLWIIHPFVPRFYMFECVWDIAPSFPVFMEYFARREKEYSNTLKIAINADGQRRTSLSDSSDEWRKTAHVAHSVPAPARNISELGYAIEYLHRKGTFRPWFRTHLLFKYCASVTTVLTLALKMKYKNLVLCGIDLHDQRYFYQDPDHFPETAHFEFAPRDVPHLTNDDRLPWHVPLKQTTLLMKERLLEPAGIKLYVENRSSALWPDIPEVPLDLLSPSTEKSKAPRGLRESRVSW